MTTHQPRRTAAQWAEVIEQQSRSGQTIRAFCKENDIGLASFGKLKQKLTKSRSRNIESSSEPVFQSVSMGEPDNTKPSMTENTTVTLLFGSNVTLTIQANQPTP